MAKEKILIVEDEPDIVRMLEYNLKKEGFRTVCAPSGGEGLRRVERDEPDIILLDLMLPEIDGLEVCRRLKQNQETARIPVIMLTAKSRKTDKIVGLELGADDYITKPFSVGELIARIKAVLRRFQDKEKLSDIFRAGNLTIDFPKIRVSIGNKQLELAAKEFELLSALAKAKGRVLSRDYLLDNIWGFDNAIEIQSRTVDVHIQTLRKKLKQEAKRIVTVKNYGYRFEIEE